MEAILNSMSISKYLLCYAHDGEVHSNLPPEYPILPT